MTFSAGTTEQAQSPGANVTSAPLSAAERKRRQRQREAEATYFTRTDWSLFLDQRSLPQKAGCQPADLRALVLRELVDNALDAGAEVSIRLIGGRWVIRDDGTGIDPEDVPELFSVNRPLVSAKQLRLPTRGMVGNGLRVVMGAVAAFDGTIEVHTRGRRMTLEVDRATGLTRSITSERPALGSGVTVFISLGDDHERDGRLAVETARIAQFGHGYKGKTSPYWYSPKDLRDLISQAPPDTTVEDVADWFGIYRDNDDQAQELNLDAVSFLLNDLRIATAGKVSPNRLGVVGEDAYAGTHYHRVSDHTRSNTEIPYVIEAWAKCRRAEQRGAGSVGIGLLLNRTQSVARLSASSGPDGITIQGCGLHRRATGKTGHYTIHLSVIAPYIELATDGKEPSLSPFSEGIVEAIQKAAAKAHHAMDKPPGSMKIVDAAERVMPTAYLIASANDTLPANARQVYYAARPGILKLTGLKELSDSYFTQNVLPDFIDSHPQAHEWDVVFDDRGRFTEPHTGRSVGLGTVSVREYLGERPKPPVAATIDPGSMANTTGPENRYRDVLFLEKEGFNALLAHAMIAERFDIAITSTKGMSNTALRQLLDGLVERGMKRVFVLHDFDASGFSIFGTLGTDSRRYTFKNPVEVVDLGLRLDDIEGIDPEPYTPAHWGKRYDTLKRHGASDEEIDFLAHHRVELNALPSDVFIEFLERKLEEHGVEKVVPDADVLEAHARQVMERKLANKALVEIRATAHAEASQISLADDLEDMVADALDKEPKKPWDLAVAKIANDTIEATEWEQWAASVAADLEALCDDPS